MKGLGRGTLLVAACLVFIVDFVTKRLTHLYLPLMDTSPLTYPYGGIPVFENFLGIEFSLSHMTNYGAAWGLFGHSQLLLLCVRMTLVVGLVAYLIFFNKNKAYALPITVVVAGAIGNILDYFIYGHVVDMLHFVLWGYDFPVFNIADCAIFLGLSSACIVSMCEPGDAKAIKKT